MKISCKVCDHYRKMIAKLEDREFEEVPERWHWLVGFSGRGSGALPTSMKANCAKCEPIVTRDKCSFGRLYSQVDERGAQRQHWGTWPTTMTARVLVLAPILLLLLMALVAKSLQRTLEPNYEHGREANTWEQEDFMSLRKRVLESLGVDEAHVTALSTYADEVGDQHHVHGARTTHLDMGDTDTSSIATATTSSSSKVSSYTTYTSTFTESDEGRWPVFTSSEKIEMLRLSFQVPHSKALSGNFDEEVTHASLRLPLLPDTRTSLWTVSSNNASSSSSSPSSTSAAFVFGKLLQLPEGPLVMEWDVTELVHSVPSVQYSFMVRCNGECPFVSGGPSTLTLTLRWDSKGMKTVRRTRRSADGRKKISDFKPDYEGRVNCEPRKGKKEGKGGSGAEQCCRKPMVVTFADLELQHLIVSPTSFNAYYCVGKCYKRRNAASSHAVIQNMMHRKKVVPRSCCAPSKLSHLNITMVKDAAKGIYETKEWKNVIVEECACS